MQYIVGTLIFIIVIGGGLLYINYDCDTTCGTTPIKIPFDDFKDYYILNPSAYDLTNHAMPRAFITNPGSYYGSWEYIKFGIVDTYRYAFWRKKKEKCIHSDEERAMLIKYLDLRVSADINTIKKRSNLEMENAKMQILNIQEELNKEIELNTTPKG